MISARVAEVAAMRSDSRAAEISASSCRSVAYQRREKPSQAVTSRDALKLSTTRKAIGAYRNA
jgi:hypothetical protein